MFENSTKQATRPTRPTLAVGRDGNLSARMTQRRPLAGQSFTGWALRSLWASVRESRISAGAPSLAGARAASLIACVVVAAVLAVAIVGR